MGHKAAVLCTSLFLCKQDTQLRLQKRESFYWERSCTPDVSPELTRVKATVSKAGEFQSWAVLLAPSLCGHMACCAERFAWSCFLDSTSPSHSTHLRWSAHSDSGSDSLCSVKGEEASSVCSVSPRRSPATCKHSWVLSRDSLLSTSLRAAGHLQGPSRVAL